MIMSNPHDTEQPDVEQLLAQVGFTFTVVARCPVTGCESCDPGQTLAAA